MSSASKTTSSSRQAMATKPKLQKALHAPARHRQMTITHTKAVWPKPLLISARDDTPSGSHTRTIQSTVAQVLQLCSQHLYNIVNIQYSVAGQQTYVAFGQISHIPIILTQMVSERSTMLEIMSCKRSARSYTDDMRLRRYLSMVSS